MPPIEEKPRKVHLHYDWKGATYQSAGKRRLYANTLCKGNFDSRDLLTTEDPDKVNCRSCLKKMHERGVGRAPKPLAPKKHPLAICAIGVAAVDEDQCVSAGSILVVEKYCSEEHVIGVAVKRFYEMYPDAIMARPNVMLLDKDFTK